jgi:hypothetical protein
MSGLETAEAGELARFLDKMTKTLKAAGLMTSPTNAWRAIFLVWARSAKRRFRFLRMQAICCA